MKIQSTNFAFHKLVQFCYGHKFLACSNSPWSFWSLLTAMGGSLFIHVCIYVFYCIKFVRHRWYNVLSGYVCLHAYTTLLRLIAQLIDHGIARGGCGSIMVYQAWQSIHNVNKVFQKKFILPAIIIYCSHNANQSWNRVSITDPDDSLILL